MAAFNRSRSIGALVLKASQSKSQPRLPVMLRSSCSRGCSTSSSASKSSVGSSTTSSNEKKGVMTQGGPRLTSGVEALRELESASLSRAQSEALVRVLSKITDDIMERQRDLIASTAELQGLRSELNEKVFNSTLKYDLAQRHLRELMERDIRNLRSELRTEERKDYADFITQVQSLERSLLKKESDDDRRIERIVTEQAHLETRILRYIFGSLFAGLTAIITIGLAAARLLI